MDTIDTTMIHIFTTGGTFDKIYFDANSTFHIGDTQVTPILNESNVTHPYQVEEILRKDSLDMGDNDRQRICESVTAAVAERIIIIHGTDTMVQTANALAACHLENKTIVLTGALQPARLRISDAHFNVGFAFAAVQLLSADIYIAMNGRIFHYTDVKKNLALGQFESQH